MCLPVDQCQRVRSFDLLSGLTRPGNRQQCPSFWTVRRRHTSSVSAHYGFNKCKPRMPWISSFHPLLEHVGQSRSKSGPSSSTISAAASSLAPSFMETVHDAGSSWIRYRGLRSLDAEERRLPVVTGPKLRKFIQALSLTCKARTDVMTRISSSTSERKPKRVGFRLHNVNEVFRIPLVDPVHRWPRRWITLLDL